jgi:hypothetical protein
MCSKRDAVNHNPFCDRDVRKPSLNGAFDPFRTFRHADSCRSVERLLPVDRPTSQRRAKVVVAVATPMIQGASAAVTGAQFLSQWRPASARPSALRGSIHVNAIASANPNRIVRLRRACDGGNHLSVGLDRLGSPYGSSLRSTTAPDLSGIIRCMTSSRRIFQW